MTVQDQSRGSRMYNWLGIKKAAYINKKSNNLQGLYNLVEYCTVDDDISLHGIKWIIP